MATLVTKESQYLSRVAEEYAARGYSVLIAPRPEELPPPLHRYRPDLVAVKNASGVVVEVTTRRGLSEDSQIRALAETVAGMPDWNFDLRIIPEGDIFPIPTHGYTREELISTIRECEAFRDEGLYAAAFLRAWSALEGALRSIASGAGITVREDSSEQLLGDLYDSGLISASDIVDLGSALHYRNALIHGYIPSELTSEVVDKILAHLRGITLRLHDAGENESRVA